MQRALLADVIGDREIAFQVVQALEEAEAFGLDARSGARLWARLRVRRTVRSLGPGDRVCIGGPDDSPVMVDVRWCRCPAHTSPP
jgi:hypothetical protein